MAFGILEGIALGGTLLNYLQGQKAQAAANAAMAPQKALDMQRLEALKALFGQAQAYDPARDTAAAGDFARQQAAKTLADALSSLSARYSQGGGVPGLSTAYLVNAQKATDNVLGPLAATLAQLKAEEQNKKLQALALAAGTGPGELGSSRFADVYLRQAGQYGSNTAASLEGLVNLLAQQKRTPTNTKAA